MSKGIRFKNKNNEHIYPCAYMPVGAIYKSTSNTNPSTIFDGTWTLVHSGYERQQIGTQVLYDEISGSGNVGKTNLIGFFVGQTLKKSAGKANPSIVNKLVNEEINKR